MSLLLELPSSIESQVVDYAAAEGKPLQQVVLECLRRELRRSADGRRRVSRFRELLAKQTKLTGEPYRFRRQDAYDEELA